MTSAYLSPVVPQIGDVLSIIRARLQKQSFFREMRRPFALESFESTSSAGPGNRPIEWPQKQLSQHSLEPVLTLPNTYVFFNINKRRNQLLSQFGSSGLFMPLCLRPQPSCHASLKFAGYSNLLNGDISKCQIRSSLVPVCQTVYWYFTTLKSSQCIGVSLSEQQCQVQRIIISIYSCLPQFPYFLSFV